MRAILNVVAYPHGNRHGNSGSLDEYLPSMKDLLKSFTRLGMVHFVEIL